MAKSNTRNEAYIEDPETAMLTDFLVENEIKLKKLHKKHFKDTGDKINFFSFVHFIYDNATEIDKNTGERIINI